MDYFSFKKPTTGLTSFYTPNEEHSNIFNLSSLSAALPTPPATPYTFETKRKRRCTNPAPSTFRFHILIVDDNTINLQILSRLLSIHLRQYIEHIELVKSGVKALEILKCRPFDLVLMDIDMPILNGMETTKHIRSSFDFDILPKNRKAPIVAVTTNASSSWRKTFDDIGMDGCIAKPISTIELKNTLARVLNLPLLIHPSTPQ